MHTKYNTGSYQARTWNVRLDGCQHWSHGHTLITWHVRKNSHAAGILHRTVIRWSRSALGHGRISTIPGCPDGRQGYPSHLPTYRSTGAKQITASMRHWSTSIPPFLHWVWRKSKRERQEDLLEHHVCVTVSALYRLGHTDVERRFCQCQYKLAVHHSPASDPSVNYFIGGDWSGREEKACCVCVLQSGAKRISKTPLPSLDTQSCGNPTTVTTPTSVNPCPTGLPSLSKKISHRLMDH